MLLSEMFDSAPDVEITGLVLDSRKVKEGNIFFCIKGVENDGHRFAKMADQAGAAAVIYSDEIEKGENAVYIKVEDVDAELNRICDLYNDHPSSKLKVIGVTGTNGKTTTTSIISDIYEKPCGYMGTIAVRYGNVSRIPSLTTPDAIEVHQDLRDMVEAGMDAVAMEVSSHGLAMKRVDAVDFDVAVFTNLTYDHLDYHKTMENYFEAKKLLFTNIKKEGVAVLNADDDTFDRLKEACSCRYVSYGVENQADYRAEDVKLAHDGTEFTLNVRGEKYNVRTNLVALYNIYNLLGAIAAMHELGMPVEKIIEKTDNISQVDGRMEILDEGQNFHAIVDYAHTPDGFEKVFSYAEEIAKGHNIYSVFGCAGKRDHAKRKVLGEIASEHCKTVFVTEEDPRTENVDEISREIMSGIEESKRDYVPDRYEAIKKALTTCEEGDVVLMLGKGAEKYMYRGTGRDPWMGDTEAAKEILRKI